MTTYIHAAEHLAYRLAEEVLRDTAHTFVHDWKEALAQLRPGDMVVTTPDNLPIWKMTPSWAAVRVEPDGYDLVARCRADLRWALGATGVPSTKIGQLVKKPPTTKSSYYDAYQEATTLVEAVQALTYVPLHVPLTLLDLMVALDASTVRVLDTETNTVFKDPHAHFDKLVGVAVGGLRDGNTWSTYYPAPVDPHVCSVLEGFTYTGHNAKYDAIVLQRHGIKVSFSNDTMLAAWVQGEEHLGLKALAQKYLHTAPTEVQSLLSRGRMSELPVGEVAAYATQDVVNTTRLHDLILAPSTLYALEMDILPILIKMETVGIKVDQQELATATDMAASSLRAITESIVFHGGPTSPRSDAAVARWLYGPEEQGGLNLPVLKGTPTGQPSTAHDVLEELAATTNRQEPSLVIQFREQAKLLDGFLTPLPMWVQEDGRVHANVRQTGARSGRFSMDSPNLQQIPEYVRRCFIAGENNVFIGADYSQLELRILAALAQDKNMMAVFARFDETHSPEDDIHEVTRRLIGTSSRRVAKNFGYAKVYGAMPLRLATVTGISLAEATRLDAAYLASYPDVARFLLQERARVTRDGVSYTHYGRLRRLPDVRSRDPSKRSEAVRQGVNNEIQGTASDIVKMKMVQLDYGLPRRVGWSVVTILQVHDELLFECPTHLAVEAASVIKEIMTGRLAGVSLPVDIHIGHRWSDLKE